MTLVPALVTADEVIRFLVAPTVIDTHWSEVNVLYCYSRMIPVDLASTSFSYTGTDDVVTRMACMFLVRVWPQG